MSKHRSWPFWNVNPLYSWGAQSCSPTTDAADEIIAGQTDKHLLTQEALFEAQGGWATIGVGLGAVALGTAAVFVGGPRTAAHFKTGSCSFMEWMCLTSCGATMWITGTFAGRHAFGNVQATQNHWMAYTWTKNQNRFEGRTILTKGYSY